jgi:hypothetical protein
MAKQHGYTIEQFIEQGKIARQNFTHQTNETLRSIEAEIELMLKKGDKETQQMYKTTLDGIAKAKALIAEGRVEEGNAIAQLLGLSSGIPLELDIPFLGKIDFKELPFSVGEIMSSGGKVIKDSDFDGKGKKVRDLFALLLGKNI